MRRWRAPQGPPAPKPRQSAGHDSPARFSATQHRGRPTKCPTRGGSPYKNRATEVSSVPNKLPSHPGTFVVQIVKACIPLSAFRHRRGGLFGLKPRFRLAPRSSTFASALPAPAEIEHAYQSAEHEQRTSLWHGLALRLRHRSRLSNWIPWAAHFVFVSEGWADSRGARRSRAETPRHASKS